MTTRRARFALPFDLTSSSLALAGTLAALAGCSGSDDSGGGNTAPPTGPGAFFLDSVSNGFGLQLPHSILEADPSGGMQPRFLRTIDDIAAFVDQANRIQPPASFPPQAVLPTGDAGNHYFLAKFSDEVDAPIALFGGCNGFDCEFLEVTSIDPTTQQEIVLPVRFFIGGQSVNSTSNLVPWVRYDAASGDLVGLVPEADGFPGLGIDQFPGAESMVAPSSILAVMDADGDLSTLEAFPVGVSLRFRIPNYLESVDRVALEQAGVATTTVGADQISPEVLGGSVAPLTRPFNGQMGVDPATSVDVLFTESIQPPTLGSLINPFPGALQLTQGPSNLLSAYNYTLRPRTAYDLTRYTLVPDRTFNGIRADGMQPNSALADVRVAGDGGFEDLANPDAPQSPAGNQSLIPFAAQFRVGIAPGRANTPVVPEALYVARAGSLPGLSVIDLNGFGQSTGSPILTGSFPQKGETRFPFNPNVTQQPAIRPLLAPGVSTIDGGSAGIFTLTLDTNLDSLLASSPVLADTSDMQLGASLDTTLRNASPPFGCQAGGGNVCALDGLKYLSASSPFGEVDPGFPNLISAAPHPNPPRLTFPALCVLPNIELDEPTAAPSGNVNLLIQGDPFGDPGAGIPPSGLLSGPWFGPIPFGGPTFGQTQLSNCQDYFIRQHIGQFLYVADRVRGEVVCLNSNRTTVLERIPVQDPTSMAISPNVDLLAVSGTLMNVVTIIDINPASATFHTVLAQIPVGDAPGGIAFDPLSEDIIVCNEGGGTLSVIDPSTLAVRKTVPSLVDQPFELAVTPRMEGFGFERGVYFAYVLGRDGQVAVFESGPDGPAGIGFDRTIGVLPFSFQAPKAIVLDPMNLDASVFIAYEGPIDTNTGVPGALGDGAISRVRIESALFGSQPIAGANPNFRDMAFSVPQTIAESAGQLNGVPLDIAFDEIANIGHLPAPTSAYTSGLPASVNGKALIRRVNGSTVTRATRPVVLLASIPAEGLVDVLQIGLATPALLDVCVNDPGVQSIEVPDVTFLTGYFSQ